MNRTRSDHQGRGIGVIGIMVFLAALAAVVFVGWKFYGPEPSGSGESTRAADGVSRQGADELSPRPPLTYTDTAGRFSLRYPADWKEVRYEEGKDGPVLTPDWTKVSRPVYFRPAKGAERNDVRVAPGCSTDSIDAYKKNADRFHTQEDLTINGYTAFYDRLDFKGDAESYLHHTYIALSGDDCVEFGFRENWRHPMSDTDFDDRHNMGGFRQIVDSIRFTEG